MRLGSGARFARDRKLAPTDTIDRPPRESYFPVRLTELEPGTAAPFDLRVGTGKRFAIFLRRGANIGEAALDGLRANDIANLYARSEELETFVDYTISCARSCLVNPATPPGRRGEVIRTASTAVARQLVEEVSSSALTRAESVIALTIRQILPDHESLIALIRDTEVTPELHVHMVNSSIYALALCDSLDINDHRKVQTLGMAGLLFDIGRAHLDAHRAPDVTSNYVGEGAFVRAHVHEGLEALESVRHIPREVRTAVQHHHERMDGSGLPRGLAGSEIAFEGRLMGAVDVFDILTTGDSSASRMSAHDALMKMLSQLKGHFDDRIISSFIGAIGPKKQIQVEAVNTRPTSQRSI